MCIATYGISSTYRLKEIMIGYQNISTEGKLLVEVSLSQSLQRFMMFSLILLAADVKVKYNTAMPLQRCQMLCGCRNDSGLQSTFIISSLKKSTAVPMNSSVMFR
jgi:hypothetical protein